MLERIEHDGIVELRLSRPPVNALTPEMLNEFVRQIRDACESGASALVVSGRPGMFSAGLDVGHFLTLDERSAREGFAALFDAMRTVAQCEVPIVAAITGHSPAGGAILAVFCDHRIMADGAFKFGFNEVQVGLPVPEPVFHAVCRLTGVQVATELCCSGRLVESREAESLGLIDQVVDAGAVVEAGLDWCRHRLALPRNAFLTTRRLARREVAGLFHSTNDVSQQRFGEIWFSDETQRAMRDLMEGLAQAKRGGSPPH